MACRSNQQWIHTNAALKIFIENFNCNKCEMVAHESMRYQKCGHLFCADCIRSESQCPTCKTPAKRTEIHSSVIVPELITYSKKISQIIKPPQSPRKKDDEDRSSTFSVQDHNVSVTKSQTARENIDKPNNKGETRLHRACVKRDIEAVCSLLQAGANPNTKDYSDWVPLHEAVSFGYYEICERLLEAGALPDAPGVNYQTALHEAAKLVHPELSCKLIKLLRQYNANVNARDCFDKTPLDYAKSEEARRILTKDEPVESTMDRTLGNASSIMQISNCTLSSNGVHILGSNLSSENTSLLNEVAMKHKIRIAKTFTSAVTHVVVEVNDQQVTSLSYDVLLALLHGKWILTHTWIKYSLSDVDIDMTDLEWVEVQGTTGASRSNAPAKARQNAKKLIPRLFNRCNFFFAMNDQSAYSYGQLEFKKSMLYKLITEGGGKVLKREPDPEQIQSCKEIPFHVGRDLTHPLHRCSHYIIYAPGQDEPQIKYNMPHIKSLPLIWLIESIEQFQLLDPTYLGT